MKNKTTILLAFLAGAIIGAVIVWMSCTYCCKTRCCSQQCSMVPDTTGLTLITVQQANTFFKDYMNHPDTVKRTLRAFTINYEQFRAMKIIDREDSTVHGFRIYMGMNGMTPVRMVVGTGSPDKVAYIYATTDESSGPCPDVCDDQSPIIAK
jgi:hypothetical protein